MSWSFKMFEMLQYRFAVVAVFTITLVFNRTYSHVTNLHKRGNVDVFNLLLGLYKLNPLKASKVYKTFSDNVMTHGDKVITTLDFDSGEKKDLIYKQKPAIKQLNEIERLIHRRFKRPLHNSMEKPEYDIENVDIEKFNVNIVVNDKLADEYNERNKHEHTPQLENFSGLIGHISKDFNEIDDMPSTKLIPVNDSAISRALSNTKLYPKKRLRDKPNVDELFDGVMDATVVQVDNDIQNTAHMNDNLETANVIVL